MRAGTPSPLRPTRMARAGRHPQRVRHPATPGAFCKSVAINTPPKDSGEKRFNETLKRMLKTPPKPASKSEKSTAYKGNKTPASSKKQDS